MSGNYVIKGASQKLLYHAFETLPLPFKGRQLTFTAQGADENSSTSEYVNNCLTNGVMPFSSATFSYDRRQGFFIPHSMNFLYHSLPADTTSNGTIDGIISGGKFARVRVDVNQNNDHLIKRERLQEQSKETTAVFTTKLLPYLRSNGYKIQHADIEMIDAEGKITTLNVYDGEVLSLQEFTPVDEMVGEWFDQLRQP